MNELNQIPIKPFRAELKRNTQIIDDETLHKWIDYFEELGYIKAVNFGVLELCNDVDRPYEFLSDKTEKNGD